MSRSLRAAPPSTRNSDKRMSAVALHGVDQVGGLERDALDRRARDVRAGRTAREPDDGAARRGIPLRRAEAGEGGHQVDVAGVGHAGGQRFDLVGTFDDAEAVAQPLHRGAAHEHAAFERELARRRGAGATVVSNRWRERCGFAPAFISAKQPVP